MQDSYGSGGTPPLAILVHATAYCYDDGSTGGVYMDGGRPWVGTVAVSHDLKHLMGHTIRVRGWKYKVRDLMHERWTKKIDFWMTSLPAAQQWGIQQVEMEVLD